MRTATLPCRSTSFLYAETRAASIAWSTTSFGRFFSAASCVIAIMNSLLAVVFLLHALQTPSGLPVSGSKKIGATPLQARAYYTEIIAPVSYTHLRAHETR